MVKDILGNDLVLGDAVVLSPEITPKMMICKITHINEGGLAIPSPVKGQAVIGAGVLRLVFDFSLGFNPTQPITVCKVVNPMEQNRIH